MPLLPRRPVTCLPALLLLRLLLCSPASGCPLLFLRRCLTPPFGFCFSGAVSLTLVRDSTSYSLPLTTSSTSCCSFSCCVCSCAPRPVAVRYSSFAAPARSYARLYFILSTSYYPHFMLLLLLMRLLLRSPASGCPLLFALTLCLVLLLPPRPPRRQRSLCSFGPCCCDRCPSFRSIRCPSSRSHRFLLLQQAACSSPVSSRVLVDARP